MTDCKICGDSGYTMRKDLEWYHPEFGKLLPCECRKEEFPDEYPDEEEEPKKRNPDLSWIDYTD